MKIPLKNGGFTEIDDKDAEVGCFDWHKTKRGRVISRPGGTLIKLHKLIAERMGIEGEVDHRDGNGLNNKRGNLRAATRSQNNCNRGKFGGRTSQYKGVYYDRGWAARIQIEGKRVWVGRFKTEIEAAKAYDVKARDLHAEFAVLNFPENNATLQPQDDTKRLDWLCAHATDDFLIHLPDRLASTREAIDAAMRKEV